MQCVGQNLVISAHTGEAQNRREPSTFRRCTSRGTGGAVKEISTLFQQKSNQPYKVSAFCREILWEKFGRLEYREHGGPEKLLSFLQVSKFL